MVQFLDSFRGDNVCQWMGDHIEVPVLLVPLYVAMVLYIPDAYMKNRKPFDLRQLNMAWNLLLAVFSTCGTYYCLPRLYRTIFVPEFTLHDYINGGNIQWKGGMYNAFCYWDRNIFFDGPVGAFVYLFILSKIPEMLDTAFLVFQKKPVRFLHWYHHVTVMLYYWHGWMSVTSSGLWFVCMNYGVHSIMYFYYFLAACGYRKYVRPVAPLITFLQIAQMVVGTIIAVYVFYMDQFGGGCDCRSSNAKLALMMYVSYVILFSNFFRSRYIKKTPRSAAPSTLPVMNNDYKKYE